MFSIDKMPRITFNRLSRRKSNIRRKGTSTTTRAKYAPKTARVNRSLIKSNAYAIQAVKRMIPPPIYTDYQYSGGYAPLIGTAPNPFFAIQQAQLMTPNLWAEVLRQDPNVVAASSTLVKRMQINLRYSLGEANWCQITTFVVSIRKDAANRVINQAELVSGEDYIYSGAQQQLNPRLNPAVFKVHYVRDVSLMSNAWQTSAATAGNSTFAGNPNTTFAKGQVNMKPNFRLRQPTGTRWRIMDQSQLVPSQRLFLLTFFRGQTNDVDDDPVRVDWDALYTCYNAS